MTFAIYIYIYMSVYNLVAHAKYIWIFYMLYPELFYTLTE